MIPALFDECVHLEITSRALGGFADIALVRDFGRVGLDDRELLELARREQRVLVTEDFGFGRLIFQLGLPSPPGVQLIDLSGTTHLEREERLTKVAATAFSSVRGQFVSLGRRRVRSRRLPQTSESSTP